ncbi:patatin-like phospholipase family protein [Azospirillum sp. YIM DDC1]|uniref:Patatin-like phospholipase family protein n=1 Tax=Azospirillum aestuarii TaxID=2802052 RepID=A0ABS1I720_9PROT|nr:patatin-like phospholipase family protein [Azospirillum aestuarii]MBK3774477.1 patatin-like phospholipase family protein [Azospirillum brasilense]MBK4722859.1 patatin-like phospholipase family protein [Azospirillum aestuarii]TWA91834.1 NTE family protein [Azospirillum brasilense]
MPDQTMPAPAVQPANRKGAKPISLALQGGGAHGSFTWGVIDRILEDGRLTIDGIVGTSAGAMNCAVTAYGLTIGGHEGARSKLREFWRRISDEAKKGPLQPTPLDKMFSKGNMDFSPLWQMFDALSRMMSPYELNPMNMNPLRDVLSDVVDFKRLRKAPACKTFIAATDVCAGRLKVFGPKDISVDAVLASACLPFLFQAVQVGNAFYWDGGYSGNPPLYPLIDQCDSRDILIIQINPVRVPVPPRTAREIMDRVNTLSFNSSMMRELRVVDFVSKLIDSGELSPEKHKKMHIHTVDAEEVVEKLGVTSKLNADWDFLMYMFETGRHKADEFLDQHFDKIGRESSTDISAKFLA